MKKIAVLLAIVFLVITGCAGQAVKPEVPEAVQNMVIEYSEDNENFLSVYLRFKTGAPTAFGLMQQIYAIEGVDNISPANYSMYITKAELYSWDEIMVEFYSVMERFRSFELLFDSAYDPEEEPEQSRSGGA